MNDECPATHPLYRTSRPLAHFVFIASGSKTLKDLPFPDPSQIDYVDRRHFIDLVRERIAISETGATEIESRLNLMVADFYGLAFDERRLVGLN